MRHTWTPWVTPAGMAINVAALPYGVFAMFLFARPGDADTFSTAGS